MPEWTKYSFKLPATSSPRRDDPSVLETVRHVVHVPEARRILEDERLRAGLVYDESRLKSSRTSVTWLSANTWGMGSIYGNVEFAFEWSDIIADSKIYWVEAMTDYNPDAYRLLITDRDLDNSRYVTPYGPSSDNGPLRERNGTWYWNINYTSEFMLDSDLPLTDCIELNFITHHSKICRHNGNSCRGIGATTSQTGGRILAFLIGNDIHAVDHVLKCPSCYDASRPLSESVDSGVRGIRDALGNDDRRFGGAIRAKASRQAVLQGALALYGADQPKSALDLIALLKSKDIFERALEELVNNHFGISGWVLSDYF